MLLNRKRDFRKFKRRFNHDWKAFVPNKTYFVNCNYYPCVLIEKRWFSDCWDIDLVGAICGAKSPVLTQSCDNVHCSPAVITKEQYDTLVDAFRNKSYKEYLMTLQRVHGNEVSEEKVDAYLANEAIKTYEFEDRFIKDRDKINEFLEGK